MVSSQHRATKPPTCASNLASPTTLRLLQVSNERTDKHLERRLSVLSATATGRKTMASETDSDFTFNGLGGLLTGCSGSMIIGLSSRRRIRVYVGSACLSPTSAETSSASDSGSKK